MIIHLIRHGKTIANEKRMFCGSSDLELSENGKAELNKLLGEVEYPKAEIYASSGLKRANQTLEILYGISDYLCIPDFQETSFGDFELKTHEELSDCPDYASWLENFKDFPCPNGELRDSFVLRVTSAFDRLIKLNKQIVLVCHGGVISVIMETLFPEVLSPTRRQPACGRGFSIIKNNDHSFEIKEI